MENKKIYLTASKDETRLLKKTYPKLLDLILHDKETVIYNTICVSIFDHWLNEEEADEYLNEISKEEQQRRDDIHFLFLLKIFNETPVYTIRYRARRKKRKYSFRKYSDINGFIKKVKDENKKPKDFFFLIFPEFEAVYCQHWDDTNVLYYLSEKKIEKIKKIALESNLYLI